MRIVFVKRGAYSTFRVLQERCSSMSDVDIRWDRRSGFDRRRRTASIDDERRRADRRTTPCSDWTLLGYTMVEVTTPVSLRKSPASGSDRIAAR